MPVLGDEHDFAHPVESDEAWSESYYFNCYDPVTDCGFYTRIGVRPNEGTLDAGIAFWLPEGEMTRLSGVREQAVMVDQDLEAGGLRYERFVPMKHWRLTAEGVAPVTGSEAAGDSRSARIAMDAEFTALTPAIGVDGQQRAGRGASAATGQSVGKGHLEQAGRWTGWIEVDGVRHTLVEGRGNRDKSWGPRRWGGPLMWRWFSINFGDDVHFGGIRIGTELGDLHRGWVWDEGRHRSIRNWDVRTELADDGISHKVSHVRATDSAGRVLELRGDVIRLEPGPSRGTIVNEGLARWTYGGLSGYGIAEYLHQLDHDGRPRVPIE
jgi:hypothetical protein